MPRAETILFLQLPQLDNDVVGAHENVYLAAAHLTCAIEASAEDAFFRPLVPTPDEDSLDDRHLLDFVCRLRPKLLACTLYLWNIERTLHLLAGVRRAMPSTRIVVGGPEVAYRHPFLFRSRAADAVVVGEGEHVLPFILRAMRHGKVTDFASVAWRAGRSYIWGQRPAPEVNLAAALPPPGHRACRPDASGMAYVETSRGCPMHCTYCRYHHLRRRSNALDTAQTLARIAALQRMGAREIRFVDPTFNANPHFRQTLRALAHMNRSRKLAFFAELRPDTIDAQEARWLEQANFREIECGVQSLDPDVLRAIRRHCRPAHAEAGIRRLLAHGIAVTVDLMYGLPGQTYADVQRSIAWALTLKGANVQCMQTLLLPGTDLRAQAGRWRIRADPKPPYGVLSTRTLPVSRMRRIEDDIASHPSLSSDTPTTRFVGRTLPGLFAERIEFVVDGTRELAPIAGRTNRRAVLFRGSDIFGAREAIAAAIRRAARENPHVLWQFVLVPRGEEPLDLLDYLVRELCALDPMVLDRHGGAAVHGKRASRRLFILLPSARRFDAAWRNAAEEVLGEAFF